MVNTNEIAKKINQHHCEVLGVDSFSSEMWIQGKPVTKKEIKYFKVLFFFEFCSEHVKSFYPWMYRWTLNGEKWQVLIDPIIKITQDGKNVYYDLDERAMGEKLYKLIQSNKGNK
jgi:hypothetical protein